MKTMTEQEWLSNTGPLQAMLKHVQGLKNRWSEREARVCGAAFCRRAGHLLPDPCLWDWVTLSERCADGGASPEELERAHAAATSYLRKKRSEDFFVSFVEGDLHGAPPSEDEMSRYSALCAADPAGTRHSMARAFATVVAVATVQYRRCTAAETCFLLGGAEIEAELHAHASYANLLRDLFGNPFRPVSLAPAWLTPVVLKLAQAAYDNRLLASGLLDNSGLAILADALEEAGCDNADILSHLRGPGPHVRGCWAVDAILGKT
jgi:hypothetical protein